MRDSLDHSSKPAFYIPRENFGEDLTFFRHVSSDTLEWGKMCRWRLWTQSHATHDGKVGIIYRMKRFRKVTRSGR